MNPLEAMQRLISIADHYRVEEGGRADPDMQKEDEVAVAVIQRMLNTATPVVRFRAFVEIDADQPRSKIKGVKKTRVTAEYAISGVSIYSILSGLSALDIAPVNVRVTLWEQRATGADMLSGFQGTTKSKRFDSWVDTLETFEHRATIQ